MVCTIRNVILLVALLVVTVSPGVSANADQRFQGKPLSYWLDALEGGDEGTLLLAFDAVRYFGPDAQRAVPALTRMIEAPFDPIRIGEDSDYVIVSKLVQIEMRAEAIDALVAIGDAASSATIPLINWAVTIPVVPARGVNALDDQRFLDLISLDIEKRVLVVIAIARIGDAAYPMLVEVLKSTDAEKRKVAVAVLGENAFPVAAKLLASPDCDTARLGIAVLEDMQPMVATDYLVELRKRVLCYAN